MIGYKNEGQQSGGGNRRRSTSTRFDYLDNTMLTTDPKTLTILDVRETAERTDGKQKFSDFTMKCRLGGSIILVGIKATPKDPIFPVLYEAFGSDEGKWLEKSFQLFLKVDEFDGSTLRHCQLVPATEEKKARR